MSQKLSRRELLKLAAAATGATVLSSVPTKWVTPLVEIGAIPAHAQGSQLPGAIAGTITVLNNPLPRPTNPAGFLLEVGTTFPNVINGVLLNGTSNSTVLVRPYIINPVPPGNNYTVHAFGPCSYSGDVSPVVVTPGNTTNNVNFTFDCRGG